MLYEVYRSFSKDSLLYMSSRLSKIRSVHTYVMPRTVYFGWICTKYQTWVTNILTFWMNAFKIKILDSDYKWNYNSISAIETNVIRKMVQFFVDIWNIVTIHNIHDFCLIIIKYSIYEPKMMEFSYKIYLPQILLIRFLHPEWNSDVKKWLFTGFFLKMIVCISSSKASYWIND